MHRFRRHGSIHVICIHCKGVTAEREMLASACTRSTGCGKAQRAAVNQGLDGDWRCVSLAMTGGCLSSKEDRVVLYVMRREPSDFEGSVTSSEDFRSLRKVPVSMEWSRQKKRSVGGESGHMERLVNTGK